MSGFQRLIRWRVWILAIALAITIGGSVSNAETVLLMDFGFVAALEPTTRTRTVNMLLGDDIEAIRYYFVENLRSAGGSYLKSDRFTLIYDSATYPIDASAATISVARGQDNQENTTSLGIRVAVESNDLPGYYEGMLVLEPIFRGESGSTTAVSQQRYVVLLQLSLEPWIDIQLDPSGPQSLELAEVRVSPSTGERILVSEVPVILRIASNQGWRLLVSQQSQSQELENRVRLTVLHSGQELLLNSKEQELMTGPATVNDNGSKWKTLMINMSIEDLSRIRAGTVDIPLAFRLEPRAYQ